MIDTSIQKRQRNYKLRNNEANNDTFLYTNEYNLEGCFRREKRKSFKFHLIVNFVNKVQKFQSHRGKKFLIIGKVLHKIGDDYHQTRNNRNNNNIKLETIKMQAKKDNGLRELGANFQGKGNT